MPVEETYVFANNRAGVGKSTSAFELVASYARRKHAEGVKCVAPRPRPPANPTARGSESAAQLERAAVKALANP